VTKSEYQELAEFIALRFDRSDERLLRVEILGEDNRHHLQIVAEAVTGLDQRFEALRSDVAGLDKRFEAFRSEVAGLDKRFEAFRSEVAVGFEELRKFGPPT